jgi:hypothetical protein
LADGIAFESQKRFWLLFAPQKVTEKEQIKKKSTQLALACQTGGPALA